MTTTSVVTAADLALGDRLHLWGDMVWRLIGGLESDAFGDANFHGAIEHGEIGHSKLCKLAVTKHRVVRTPGLIRHSERGFLKVVVQLRGNACFEQNGRRVWLAPGEWSVYDTTRAYSVHNPGDVEQLVLMVPKEELDCRGLQLENLMVQRFSGRRGISRLACETALGAFDSLAAPAPPADALGRHTAEHLADLLMQSLRERSGQHSALSLRTALRDRADAYIRRNLADAGLSVAGIAAALNCSKRHLHNAFAEETDSLGTHILHCRLDACRRDLEDPRAQHRSIADIALAWGFNNAAHFSRVFRDRYGRAPREYRAEGDSGWAASR